MRWSSSGGHGEVQINEEYLRYAFGRLLPTEAEVLDVGGDGFADEGLGTPKSVSNSDNVLDILRFRSVTVLRWLDNDIVAVDLDGTCVGFWKGLAFQVKFQSFAEK